MTSQERAKLIASYKDGYQQVMAALADITPAELDFKIEAKKWSCREIVHHLADSETISGHRLRRLLTESSPYIQAYDQDEFARRLRYASRPIAPALDAFRSALETTAQLFDFMSEEDWKRTGEHSDLGPYSVERWLQGYSSHARSHADQIRRNREHYKKRS